MVRARDEHRLEGVATARRTRARRWSWAQGDRAESSSGSSRSPPRTIPSGFYAHRHLAEVRLEQDPWRAALHLRRVVAARANDDVAHSLMALAQALLGQLPRGHALLRARARAVAEQPLVPSQLGSPARRRPRRSPPRAPPSRARADERRSRPEHEIVASTAHCLARLGRLEEARELATHAVTAAPRSSDHAALLAWIERGAPSDEAVSQAPRGPTHNRRASGGRRAGATARDDRRGGGRLARAQHARRGLLQDRGGPARAPCGSTTATSVGPGSRSPRSAPPRCTTRSFSRLVSGNDGITQTSIARRYGVRPRSLSSRYGDIRQTLALRPGDPRWSP